MDKDTINLKNGSVITLSPSQDNDKCYISAGYTIIYMAEHEEHEKETP